MELLKKLTKYIKGAILVLFTGLISTPIITRLFSPESYGKYSLFITYGALISNFLYLGLDQSFVRYFYDECENKRSDLLQRCMLLPLIVTTFISIIIIIFGNEISNVIIKEKSVLFSIIFSIYIFLLVLNRFTLLNIRMKQKATLYSRLNVLHKVLYLIFSLAMYYFVYSDSFYSLIYGMFISETVFFIISVYCEKEDYVFDSQHNKLFNKYEYKKLITYGFPLIFSAAITHIFKSTDKVMLSTFSDYNEVGIYTGAITIVNLLTQVQVVFTTFWVPVAMEQYSKDSENKLFFVKINEIVGFVMLVLATILILFKDIIILFLGNKYIEASYVFPLLVLMPIMYTISETTVVGINFKNKSVYHVWVSIISAVINIILNYLLIPIIGAKGAAISTGLSYVVFFLVRTKLSNKCYDVNYKLFKFGISCSFVYIYAIYASFYSLNTTFIMLGFSIIFILCIIYRNLVVEWCKAAIKQFKLINSRKIKI